MISHAQEDPGYDDHVDPDPTPEPVLETSGTLRQGGYAAVWTLGDNGLPDPTRWGDLTISVDRSLTVTTWRIVPVDNADSAPDGHHEDDVSVPDGCEPLPLTGDCGPYIDLYWEAVRRIEAAVTAAEAAGYTT